MKLVRTSWAKLVVGEFAQTMLTGVRGVLFFETQFAVAYHPYMRYKTRVYVVD